MGGIVDWIASNIWGIDDGRGYVCDNYYPSRENPDDSEEVCVPVRVKDFGVDSYKNAVNELYDIVFDRMLEEYQRRKEYPYNHFYRSK